jgi:hypothetical protein
MSDEHSLTSRQADQLQTFIANVESGLKVIMEQVAQLPTRKESAPKATASEIGDPGEDERVRLKRPIDFFDGKAPGSPNFMDDGKGDGVHYPQPKFGRRCRHDRTGKSVATFTDRRHGGACWRRSIGAARGVSASEPARQCPARYAG